VSSIIRQSAELNFADELAILRTHDQYAKPDQWLCSPRAVLTYIMGGECQGHTITPKYIGDRRYIEMAIATLLTDRALLLLGIPGTGKSWVAEHLAAAISGQSTLLLQGTAGMGEEHIRYAWNYAQLIAKGPSQQALVESPIMQGMQKGSLVRIEELTRMPSEVQDALITVLSEKMMPIPELNTYVQAQKGFNIIATANDKDRGVHELSSALKRRFNVVVLPTPHTVEEEIKIVQSRVQMSQEHHILLQQHKTHEQIQKVVTIFRELRQGETLDHSISLKQPNALLSAAEAISVVNQAMSLSLCFGSLDSGIQSTDLASALHGVMLKEGQRDHLVWQEYLETVMKHRNDWQDLYEKCSELSETFKIKPRD
jgi:MoxR-like ATPase